MSDTQDSSIIVDLNYLEATKPLERDHLLFIDLFDQVCRNIERKVSKEKPTQIKDNTTPFRNYNLCFFINGGRGMGKSTFLRALKQHLVRKDEQNTDAANPRPIIQSLADVDPTELADGESFFIHVLSKIHEKIQSKYGNVYQYQSEILEKLNRASACIQSMSKGLQLISNTERNLTEAVEASIFIEESVAQCASSSTLRQQFTELMGILCELEGAKGFLITIDDADMNFNKCSEVLETVRKYMLSPHLIFVFAGDLKLYSLVVRGMQMKHFGELSLKYDHNRKLHRMQLLDNLEEQYIMKLFPTENRINLPSVADLVMEQGRRVKLRSENKDTDLRSYICSFLKDFFAKTYIIRAETFIESMTTRSMLQLLQYWHNHAVAKRSTPAYYAEVTLGIQLIATHALMKHQIDYNLIHGQNFQELIRATRDYIFDLGRSMSGALLMPNVGEFTHKLVSFYLSSEVARQTQNEMDKLRYLCCLFPHLHILFNLNETKDEYTRGEIGKLRMALREFTPRQWGALFTARLSPKTLGNFRSKRFGLGCIRLMKESQANGKPKQSNKRTGRGAAKEITPIPKLKRNGVRDFLKELQSSIEKHAAELHKNDILYCLALYHSFSKVTERASEACYISIYNLLFFILDCVDVLRQSGTDAALETAPNLRQELTNSLISLLNPQSSIPSAVREYKDAEDDPSYFWEDEDEDKEMDVTSEDCLRFFTKFEQEIRSIAEDIIKWWELYGKATSPSYATSFVACWEQFRSNCANNTESSLLTASNLNDFAAAGTLFTGYLNSMTDAMDKAFFNKEKETDQESETEKMGEHETEQEKQFNIGFIVKEFPLWKVLVDPDLANNDLHQLTNRLNIGTLTYTGTARQTSAPQTEQQGDVHPPKAKRNTKKNTDVK